MTIELFPPNFELESKDFANSWELAVKFCMKNGYVDSTDTGLKSKDMCSRITLTGKAINQIKSRQLHNKFPTKEQHLTEYVKQFTSDFDASVFEYTYFDRLVNYPVTERYYAEFSNSYINQLENISHELRQGSRRNQALTWIPSEDQRSVEPPCLQRIWIRVLEEPDYEFGIKKKGMVEAHLSWRSRDLFSAWMSNLVAVIFMVYNQILKDDYEIVKLVDSVNAAHIQEADWKQAGNV